MKQILLDLLICPRCLPDENRLHCQIETADGDDIETGRLTCSKCNKIYPIADGIAELLPDGNPHPPAADSKYESPEVVSSYLWSHYGDLLKEPEASDAYRRWAGLLSDQTGMALDCGCAVGRFTFEMSQRSDFAVGIDISRAFVTVSRKLMKQREMTVRLKEEGLLTRELLLRLPESWSSEKVEFVLADALALPFSSDAFSSISSLNIVDKIPRPLCHLKEINRVGGRLSSQFVFSDPFSWSFEVAEKEQWLGGIDTGPCAGRGIDNVQRLLEGKDGQVTPSWSITERGHVWWKIRSHANHFEKIRSCYLKAIRSSS